LQFSSGNSGIPRRGRRAKRYCTVLAIRSRTRNRPPVCPACAFRGGDPILDTYRATGRQNRILAAGRGELRGHRHPGKLVRRDSLDGRTAVLEMRDAPPVFLQRRPRGLNLQASPPNLIGRRIVATILISVACHAQLYPGPGRGKPDWQSPTRPLDGPLLRPDGNPTRKSSRATGTRQRRARKARQRKAGRPVEG
jgi:hypothetical protein